MSEEVVMRRLVDDFAQTSGLSPRQCEMIWLAVIGLCRKEAAVHLACSVKTVECYWKRIYEKTGCRSEAEVIAMFIRAALATFRKDCA